ncbi:MAG: ABC transporter substrate-binding protein [Desulfarculaceae bacterium]|nr:ABC transporter substrate-binding protein [Desulfarculaceae bacterium]
MIKKTMRGVIGFLILMLALAVQPALAGEAKILKIGAVDSLTGWMAAGEQPTNDGAKLAAAWINDNGGIKVKGVNYKIELISEDSKSTPQGMAAAVTKLVEKEGVKFIIGGVNPVQNTAASSITEPAGVLRLSNYTCATPEESGPQFPLTFFMNSNVQGARAMLTYLKKNYPNVKTLALSHPGDGGGENRRKHLEPIANELGMTIVFSGEWPGTTVDFTPFVRKALQTKPDAFVFTDAWAYHVGSQLKALRALGFKGPAVSTDSEIVAEVLEVSGPKITEGYAAASWDMNSPEMKPVFKKDFLAYAKKAGKNNAWMAWGWNTLWVLTQAIEKSQSLDPTVVAKYLRNDAKDLQTLFGTAIVSGQKTLGAKAAICAPQAIFVAKDGKPAFVEWVTAETP